MWKNKPLPDEPEIHVDKSWLHADLGVEVEISCVVYAQPKAEVSDGKREGGVKLSRPSNPQIIALLCSSALGSF